MDATKIKIDEQAAEAAVEWGSRWIRTTPLVEEHMCILVELSLSLHGLTLAERAASEVYKTNRARLEMITDDLRVHVEERVSAVLKLKERAGRKEDIHHRRLRGVIEAKQLKQSGNKSEFLASLVKTAADIRAIQQSQRVAVVVKEDTEEVAVAKSLLETYKKKRSEVIRAMREGAGDEDEDVVEKKEALVEELAKYNKKVMEQQAVIEKGERDVLYGGETRLPNAPRRQEAVMNTFNPDDVPPERAFTHVRDCSAVCDLNERYGRARVISFGVSLKGQALIWFNTWRNTHEPAYADDYELVATAFLTQFGGQNPAAEFTRQFNSLKKGAAETVMAFRTRFEEIASLIGAQPTDMNRVFYEALQSKEQRWLHSSRKMNISTDYKLMAQELEENETWEASQRSTGSVMQLSAAVEEQTATGAHVSDSDAARGDAAAVHRAAGA